MPDHTRAIVPLEAWAYSSPDCRLVGRQVDVGLLCESLLYYESIQLNIGTPPQFAELLQWFIDQGSYSDFLALLVDGTVSLADYSFLTSAIRTKEGYSIWNIQDPVHARPNSFPQRYLYGPELRQILPHARHRVKLFNAIRGRVREFKSDEFGSAVENARADILDPRRHALIVQEFLDAIYPLRGLGRPPTVVAEVEQSADGTHSIHWNVNFEKVAQQAGSEIGFHEGMPFTAGAVCNKHLWAAALLKSDLYLAQPMARLVGDKLYESLERPVNLGKVVEQLKGEVEFPDIRAHVNAGNIKFDQVLKIRRKAEKFRRWLQSGADRDRNAILAYHHEVARDSGLLRFGRKTLNLFGILGGGALGSAVGTVLAGPVGGAVGGVAGSATTYLFDIASKIGAEWRPVVFGEWLRERIEHLNEND